MKIYANTAETIGRTPLVRLQKVIDPALSLYDKLG